MSPTTTTSPSPRRLPVVANLLRAMEPRGLVDHAERVAALSAGVCRRMGLSARPTDVIVTAALLHDIGKLAVPSSILEYPGGLTETEWRLVREHAVTGGRTLARVPGLAAEALLVRHTRERWDGWGYPDGLSGGLIPLGSRVIATCEAWDAMLDDRPHRAARTRDEAIDVLLAGAGAQWDVDVVAALLAHVGPHQGIL